MKPEQRTAPAPVPAADWISDLAPDLIGNILSYLPLKEAIQTSILSRSWRHRWRSALRHLNLNQDIISGRDHGRFAEIVDGVLRAVTSPINSFELFTRTATSDIPRWIDHAVTCGATTFQLVLEKDLHSCAIPKLGQLPDSLFSFRGLKSLSLSSFVVRLPPGFKGFEQLTRLALYSCECSPEGELGSLIANSPSLTTLVICQVKGWKDMEIFSPALRFLLIASYYINWVSLKKCPNLEAFYINVYGGKDGASSRNIADIFHGHCGKLQDFTLRNGFSYGHIPGKLPQILESLRFLTVSGNLRLSRNRAVAWCILRSSPALESLKVLPLDVNEEEEGEIAIGSSAMSFLEAGEGLCCKLNQLRSAIIHWSSLRNVSHEGHLEFWEDLLANSPALEHFTIHIDSGEEIIEAEEILMELSMHLKASESLEFKVKCKPMQRCGFVFGE